ncbi:Hypothetical predicted protein [Mytilus galloprovincialis]|uniref:Mab-21-like HhH/H2TH-like domain-containing protein n=2 Tax=Mytilus galloprovincialis TaxID=29158 RepID=A0A8B6CPL0_MYTGA|nr:Hypothetical predicted protein [Mytilus galloprovincialis]
MPENLQNTYIKFQNDLKKESGTAIELLFTGNHAQNLLAFHWKYPPNTPMEMGMRSMTDIDVLLVNKYQTVAELPNSSIRQYIMKEISHSGYVELFKGKKKILSKGFKKYWKTIIDKVQMHTFLNGRGNKFPARGYKSSGPALTKLESIGNRTFYDHDFVPALKCVSWPSQAKEWKLRKRQSGWPSPDLIKKCLMSDCHVVPVGHKCSSKYYKRKEWRMSFTGASNILAHSLSFNQRQTFILSKLLIKDTINILLKRRPSLMNFRLVTSHEIKTTFLWLCEEKLTWDNIFIDCHEIVEKLIYFLCKRVLPDYFIPEKNIIETLSEEAIDQCIGSLRSVNDNLLTILNKCLRSIYADVINYPLPMVPQVKAFLSDVDNFNESGCPSNRLCILTLVQLVVDALTAAFMNSNMTDNFIEIGQIYLNLTFLQNLLIRRLQIKTFFDLDLVKQLSDHPFSTKSVQISEKEVNGNAGTSIINDEMFECLAEVVIDIADNFCTVLSADFIFEYLQMDIWAAVSLFLGDLCIQAGIQYRMRQEIICFESLIEQNSDKPELVESLLDGYGTKEDLQKNSAISMQKVDNWFEIYGSFAECGLALYFNTCKKLKLEDTIAFSCFEEKMSVSFAKSLHKNIPEIIDDEMVGSFVLRNRIKLLFHENFDDLDYSL